MSPNEAAELLGVSPSATRDEVQRAYDARIAEIGADDQRRWEIAAARDALLAASAWQAPGAPAAAQLPPQPTQPPPPQVPQSAQPAQPTAPYPGFSQQPPPYPGYPQQQPPSPPAGGVPGPNPGPWSPPAPRRRGLSTGAIVGITLGSVAVALVVLLIAVISIVSIAHSTSRLASSQSTSSAAPFDDPSDDPSGGPEGPMDDDASGEVADYDVDGVHVHYVDGWTFELTATRACVGATIAVGFADTPDGGTQDVWSTVADLPAGVPYELTVPDDASEYDYAGIDSVDCTQT